MRYLLTLLIIMIRVENEQYNCQVRDNTGSLSFVSNPVISGLFEA
jgi:hypothetical protein